MNTNTQFNSMSPYPFYPAGSASPTTSSSPVTPIPVMYSFPQLQSDMPAASQQQYHQFLQQQQAFLYQQQQPQQQQRQAY
ncbi:hypothetical protein DM01DRAFT_1074788 [Hesseltinella vesiculosa]|uniref:Uncharacterized protein n=1 Tax=Hesseltinella vesiculosa TaxID=101127 RepID=A0A1X2GW15_9FUNG|nr:hypothetical protein DM01DRAFT_1074788 [Hesseltinella vesiculosa]